MSEWTGSFASAPRSLQPEAPAALLSESPQQIRQGLLQNIHLLPPFFCYWPRWWWWRFDCDEIRVVETDASGRFEALILDDPRVPISAVPVIAPEE